MQFSGFSLNELKEINRRTIERLRAQSGHGAPSGPVNVGRSAAAGEDVIGNLQNAKFSRSEIRNAFIAANKKLNERA